MLVAALSSASKTAIRICITWIGCAGINVAWVIGQAGSLRTLQWAMSTSSIYHWLQSSQMAWSLCCSIAHIMVRRDIPNFLRLGWALRWVYSDVLYEYAQWVLCEQHSHNHLILDKSSWHQILYRCSVMPWAINGYLCLICLSFGAWRYSRIKATRSFLKNRAGFT